MKCTIVYLIKGEAKSYHNNLARKISKKFNVNCVSDKIDPHITLKYFDQQLDENMLQQVEAILGEFVKIYKKSKIRLKGIGHLVKELNKLKWISWLECDREKVHFHSTLATEDIEEKFDEIVSFLSAEKPDFNLDNITIMAKPKEKWIIHKEFLLK